MRPALAALAALLMCAPADAHIPGADRYLALAERAFPNHCEPLRIVQLHEVDQAPGVLAWFDSHTCTIAFPAEGLHWWDPVTICSVLAHEVGHAAGLPHTDDPADLMFPEYRQAYAPCRELLRPSPRAKAHRRKRAGDRPEARPSSTPNRRADASFYGSSL